MHIGELEITDEILDKIERTHGVTFDEVENACLNEASHHRRRMREGLTLLYCRTVGGRYLPVVLAPRGDLVWAVVTARDLNAAERRLYREQKGLA